MIEQRPKLALSAGATCRNRTARVLLNAFRPGAVPGRGPSTSTAPGTGSAAQARSRRTPCTTTRNPFAANTQIPPRSHIARAMASPGETHAKRSFTPGWARPIERARLSMCSVSARMGSRVPRRRSGLQAASAPEAGFAAIGKWRYAARTSVGPMPGVGLRQIKSTRGIGPIVGPSAEWLRESRP